MYRFTNKILLFTTLMFFFFTLSPFTVSAQPQINELTSGIAKSAGYNDADVEDTNIHDPRGHDIFRVNCLCRHSLDDCFRQ